jgi:Amt family ammonium transporter
MTGPRRARILVADDDPTATLFAQAALEDAGFEAICVPDGAQALERFLAGGIELVVLDVEMPVLDGFAACAAIRSSAAGVHTPILMLTGREDLESIDQAFEAGANDFVTKPVAWTILCQRIRYMLRASEAFARLRESQQAAEEANDAKRRFLACASHELRTPLHTILGFLELLDSGAPESPEELSEASLGPDEAVQTIKRSAQHLLRLVDDLLDLSQIEAGRLRVKVSRFSVSELLNDLATALRPSADDHGAELVTRVHCGVESLASDATRVRQILTNLAVNAIKCTSGGRVEILASPGEQGAVQFEVRDTGPGMTSQQLDRAFEPFTQGGDLTAQGRAGLGLTVVLQLTEALGGTVHASSTPGSGTEICVCLPTLDPDRADEGDGASRAGANSESLRSTRVLVVDDGPDNRRLLDVVLRKAGSQVTLASDGYEGLALGLEALRAGEPFDVVLMDLQMPRLDGYEAVSELRRAGYTSPIVALTANALHGERERSLSSGFDGFLTKPIDREGLLHSVAAWIVKAHEA